MVEYPTPLWKDYELLDSGAGEKLERFGAYVLARPEPKALWDKTLPEAEWKKLTHTRFSPGAGFGKAGKEDSGTWDRFKKMDDQWCIHYPGAQKGLDFDLRLGLTSFKHVGVFPEQAANWEYIYRNVRELASADVAAGRLHPENVGCADPTASGSPSHDAEGGTVFRTDRTAGHNNPLKPKVLNLFAYTGAASLAAKAAGAEVTHLDSVRQVVTWARGNMERSGMDGIRWIVEDAMKFARREARRGNLYDGIILDPPAYGHGPDGEKWKLDECLFEMLKTVSAILKPRDSFMVLNLYSNGYSAKLGETLVQQAFGLDPDGKGKYQMESGELALADRFGKALPLSIFVRLRR